jgi:hypothetical protein
VGALLWLAVSELISAGVGGYLAGRLRIKWANIHSDEVYFRDTAHGFLVWAVALVITAAFLTSAASTMVGNSVRDSDAASTTILSDPNRYFVDSLFRGGQTPNTIQPGTRDEISLIFAHAIGERELSGSDKAYLVDSVVSSTGLSRPDAEARVASIFDQARQATDAARKAVAHSLYWLFVSLLLGAFTASFAATFGGKQRDLMHARL